MIEPEGTTYQKEQQDLEGWHRTFSQMWDMYFKPEIEMRIASGLIGSNFNLYLAQLLQPPDQPSKILLNEEVRGTVLLKASRSVEKGGALFFYLILSTSRHSSCQTTSSIAGTSLLFALAKAGV